MAAKAVIAPIVAHNVPGLILDNKYTEPAKIPIAIAISRIASPCFEILYPLEKLVIPVPKPVSKSPIPCKGAVTL